MLSHQKLTVRATDLIAEKQSLDNIRKYIGSGKLTWTSSGRAALKHILLHEKEAKNIAIPAFTCHVVVDAIKRAGKRPVIFDSGAVADVEDVRMVVSNIDALVLPYNFGFMADTEKIARVCRKEEVLLIEDCAQAIGAELRDNKAGSFGKYAFYSFGISKNIGFVGGMIRGKNIEINTAKLPFAFRAKLNIEAAINNAFFSRYFYGFGRKLLERELEKEHDDIDYEMPEHYKNVVLKIASRYDKILKIRRENANICTEELDGIIDFIKPIKDSKAAWLYFVLMSKQRDKLRKLLLRECIDVQPMRTFGNIGRKENTKASNTEKEHLVFALYRDTSEVWQIIKKIKKVSKVL